MYGTLHCLQVQRFDIKLLRDPQQYCSSTTMYYQLQFVLQASSLPVLVNENRYPEVPNLVLQQLLGRYTEIIINY